MESREFAQFQESEEAGGDSVNRLLATLSQNNNSNNFFSTTTTTTTANGGNTVTMKRQSPLSSSSLQEPTPSKKARPPIYPKIVSPPSSSSSPSTSIPFLRRCVSDPMPEINNLGLFSDPPPQPNLRPSVSDPIHHPPLTSTHMGFNESPTSKRLKIMKECIKDSSEWLNYVLHEAEEDLEKKEESENKCETVEEAVSVEKTGEGLMIHFKCPCSKGYQILLSENNCYYKQL